MQKRHKDAHVEHVDELSVEGLRARLTQIVSLQHFTAVLADESAQEYLAAFVSV